MAHGPGAVCTDSDDAFTPVQTFVIYKAIQRVEDFLSSKATAHQNSSYDPQFTNHWSIAIHASKSPATGSSNASAFGPTWALSLVIELPSPRPLWWKQFVIIEGVIFAQDFEIR
ncbi:hypothetical protein T10_552 [Trichinella papuae]|uniref:Uncharacterized protein n=1 Tax=Trichinella papuae TaxID=268474 RepID=A0A0V1MIK8_9BILA|nr:hypothetical protein T10_552 [Trichinella papuae]